MGATHTIQNRFHLKDSIKIFVVPGVRLVSRGWNMAIVFKAFTDVTSETNPRKVEGHVGLILTVNPFR